MSLTTKNRRIYARRRIAATLLGLIILIIFIFFKFFKNPDTSAETVAVSPAEPSTVRMLELLPNGYNNKNILTRGDRKKYLKNGIVNSYTGIDVSFAQKKIDWEKVKKDGIDFAIVRVGYRGYESGKINKDEYFDINMSGAAEAGVGTGVYFFSQAINEEEAEAEAEFVLEQIEGYDIKFPIAFDWEEITESKARTDNISSEMLTKCAITFCQKIKEAGYRPIIYASLNLLRDQFEKYDISEISKYDLWLAEYKDYPEYQYHFKMWQYCSDGKIDGIDCLTDINLYFW